MYDLIIDFIGLSDTPFFVQFFVVLTVCFMAAWLVCNFVNLLFSTIFSIFK